MATVNFNTRRRGASECKLFAHTREVERKGKLNDMSDGVRHVGVGVWCWCWVLVHSHSHSHSVNISIQVQGWALECGKRHSEGAGKVPRPHH